MAQTRVELAELRSDLVPDPVPYAVVLPPGYEGSDPLPLCLNLHGGGGSRDMLAELSVVLDTWFSDGSVEPMVIASASTGELSFYLDEPGGAQWETFIARAFPAHLREKYNVRTDAGSTLLTGVSMGGHGCLKIAFARPTEFAAVAALEPAIEPGFRAGDSTARSRVYYLGGGNTDRMLGPDRDDALFEANSPAARLRHNVDAVRSSGLAIYVECGDHDALNLHDGTEFLHRVLWDYDISHEYHLVRDGDHVGPTLLPRMHEAFRWLSEVLRKNRSAADPELTDADRAFMKWADSGFEGEAPAFDLNTESAVQMLRLQFSATREAAEKVDPTAKRRYAVMPPTE